MSPPKKIRMNPWSIFLLLATLLSAFRLVPAQNSDASTHSRAVVRRVVPIYPVIARRLSVTGTVKIIATVAPNGSVKSIETVGGHPILVKAAQEAVMNWKFASRPAETKESVEIHFTAQ